MTTKELVKETNLTTEINEQGISRVINTHFNELMSLGPSTTKDICSVFKDFLVSSFGLDYFSKLNLVVKNRAPHMKERERDEILRWIDDYVMGGINDIYDTDVFNNKKSISALGDIIFALQSSLRDLKEEDVEEEIDYIFDIPFRLSEMVKESSHIPRFYTHSFRREKPGCLEKGRVNISDREVSITYTRENTQSKK